MKTRSLPVALLLAGALAAVPFLSAADSNGPIDLNTLKISGDNASESVEVNLDAALLSFAAKISEVKDPEAARLIGGLRQVQVRVFKQDKGANEDLLRQMDAIRAKLDQLGWKKAVSVRDAKGANVDVHVHMGANDAIEGLVVTVIGDKQEAVFVNITGEIRPEQLAKLGARLNIDPLQKLPLCAPASPPASQAPAAVAPETKG